MTTGLKTPSNYYLELINTFPPRPITNQEELIATQERIKFILDKKSDLNQDERDYVKVLGTLAYEYENISEPMPKLEGVELLQALLEEGDVQIQDLIGVFESELVVYEVLQGKRPITEKQSRKIAAFYL